MPHSAPPAAEAAQTLADDERRHYDAPEMAFHWATAALVVALFLLAEAWGFVAAKGSPARHAMQSLHVSLGLLLATVLVLRILWRIGPGRRPLPASSGLIEMAAIAVHYLLYGLLVCQVVLGVLWRWGNHDPLSLFGWFTVPALLDLTKPQAHFIGQLHNWVAWLIIGLAGLHAGAALGHHFVLRDDVLRRMLPLRRARRI